MAAMDLFSLLGGLGLFLFGMRTMSEGLEKTAGSRLRPLLERATRSRLRGVATGALLTALIQSSSAATVMTVGFVQAGLMTLRQAAGVIMGANIGTTATSLMLSAKIDFGAVFASAGLVMMFIPKRFTAARNSGTVLTGLGILFAGMDAMSDAVHPLRELPAFRTAMAQVCNPLAGLVVGTIVTAVIQSSSASIGILQAIAGEGLISLNGALYILFGQNIGTCITAMLACAGASRDAKRAALLHLLFNMIGAGLMTAAALLFPLDAWISALAPDSPRLQIALAHVLFNLATTAVLLPASGLLVRMACSLARQQQ